jgi:hypothetical protein
MVLFLRKFILFNPILAIDLITKIASLVKTGEDLDMQ